MLSKVKLMDVMFVLMSLEALEVDKERVLILLLLLILVVI